MTERTTGQSSDERRFSNSRLSDEKNFVNDFGFHHPNERMTMTVKDSDDPLDFDEYWPVYISLWFCSHVLS